jgi:hypothetical protein
MTRPALYLIFRTVRVGLLFPTGAVFASPARASLPNQELTPRSPLIVEHVDEDA